jgi:hypothetical protein
MSTTSNTAPDTTSVAPVPETEPVKLMSEIMSELLQVNFVDIGLQGFSEKPSSTKSSSTKSSSIELPNIKTDDLYTSFKGLITNQVINRQVPFEDDSYATDLIFQINHQLIMLWKSYPKKSLSDLFAIIFLEDKVPITLVALKSKLGNYYVPRVLIMTPKDIDPAIDQSKFNLQYIHEVQAAQLLECGFSSVLEAAETFDDLDECVKSYN